MPENELKIQAESRKDGMSLDELIEAIKRAKVAGFTATGRTEVGFRGQIQSMTFRTGEKK